MYFYSIIVIVLSTIFYSQFIIYYTYIFFFSLSLKSPHEEMTIKFVLYCNVSYSYSYSNTIYADKQAFSQEVKCVQNVL